MRELVLTLTAEMIRLGKQAPDLETARSLATRLLDGGRGLEKFRDLVAAQGGDPEYVDHPERFEIAPGIEDIVADRDGCLVRFETREIGLACNALGAGRIRMEDSVDSGVGITLEAKRGDAVHKGDRLARIHHREGRGLQDAISRICAAIHIEEAPPPPRPIVIRRIAKE